ncbi:MAG: hypothetical protein NW237_03645 [Cyanobacteriota bacterium]|nr:hypothetical protein [Cyanobacteriota bacterium]
MERKRILIATKTYPSISRKYKETVCTAGVLLDNNDQPIEWIRIYPIRFRDLSIDQQYPRWSIIEADIERNDKDYRVESYRIDDQSIRVIRKIDTKNSWAERKSLLYPLESQTLCEIKSLNKSLGMIKPKQILKYFHKETSREWSPRQEAILDQMDMFEPSSNLEKIPYQFGYRFLETDNTLHNFTISDWEIMQLYRNCRLKSQAKDILGKESEALEKVRLKLENEFMYKKELHFIVGNLKNHKNTFMIIGLFYPPLG